MEDYEDDYEEDENPEATEAANAIIFALFDQAKKQLYRDTANLASPTDISFGNAGCRKKESHFTEDDEIIFYMVLDYPIRFSCCHINDFKDAYLNARTDIKVEIEALRPYTIFEYDWATCYPFIALNKCVPVFRTKLGKLPKEIETIEDSEPYPSYIECLIKGRIQGFLDYLIAQAITSGSIYPNLKQAIDEFRKYEKLPDMPQKQIKAICSKYSDIGTARLFPSPSAYFVTTWDEENGFTDKWMYFDEFIEEAKRIINGKHPCENYLEEYPELKKLVDIDTLHIFDLWLHHKRYINLDFLYQVWFYHNWCADGCCVDFQDYNFKLKSREKAYADYLRDMEYMGEITETDEVRDKRRFFESHKTAWGYKKELDPKVTKLTYKPGWE